MLEPHLAIELTGREIIFLCDQIKNKEIAEGIGERDTFIPVAREALLILAPAFLAVVQDDGYDLEKIVSLSVPKEFTWLARNLTGFGSIGIDKQPIGPRLLRKIYTLIIRFNDELDLDIDDSLTIFEEDFLARASKDTSDSAYYLPGGRAWMGDGPGQNLPKSEGHGTEDSNTTSPIGFYED